MKAGTIWASLVACGAAPSSPACSRLTAIALGVGSRAFMALTMPYRWLLIPAGVLIAAGFALYVRERGRSEEIRNVVGMRLWYCPCPQIEEPDQALADLADVRRRLRELLRASARSGRRGEAAVCRHIERPSPMEGRR